MGANPTPGTATGPLPLDASYFRLDITGLTTANFSSVSGLDGDVQIIESFTTDAIGGTVRKRTAGVVKFPAVTATASLSTTDRGLDDWMTAVVDQGLVATNIKQGTLTLFNAANTPVATWTLTGAVLTSLQLSSIGVDQANHLTYTATFDCMDVQRMPGGGGGAAA